MSLTQFAMVEELASLIKDNLQCKHLVLAIEETLVDFLQDDTSDGVIELQPMNPYSRLLLHRLADIFGFSHQSTGEGEDRHLILKRCQESSIPSILVGDLLLDYDECHSLSSSQLLSRRQVSSVLKEGSPGKYDMEAERGTTQVSLEEREAAYEAARERIFSCDRVEEEEREKRVKKAQQQKHNPVVARRMIAHALGQKIEDKERVRRMETSGETSTTLDGRHKVVGRMNGERKHVDKEKKTKEEHMGAAKRMFAHALGIHSKSGQPNK